VFDHDGSKAINANLYENDRVRDVPSKEVAALIIHELHVLQSCICRSIMYGLIIDSHDDLLPFGLIAQLVGHSAKLVRPCTGIVVVRVRVPVLASIFHAFLATTEEAL